MSIGKPVLGGIPYLLRYSIPQHDFFKRILNYVIIENEAICTQSIVTTVSYIVLTTLLTLYQFNKTLYIALITLSTLYQANTKLYGTYNIVDPLPDHYQR